MDRPHRMGKPVRRAGFRPQAPFLLIVLMAILAACDNQQDQATVANPPAAMPEQSGQASVEVKAPEATPPTETQRQTALKKLGEAMREPKRDVRVIGDGRLPAPPVPEEGLVRISPAETAAQKNARQKALIPEKPDLFPRPVVLQVGELLSGGTLIRLSGIDILPKD